MGACEESLGGEKGKREHVQWTWQISGTWAIRSRSASETPTAATLWSPALNPRRLAGHLLAGPRVL